MIVQGSASVEQGPYNNVAHPQLPVDTLYQILLHVLLRVPRVWGSIFRWKVQTDFRCRKSYGPTCQLPFELFPEFRHRS